MRIVLNINPKVDNSPSINAAIAAAKEGDTIQFPSGLIPIHEPIVVDKRLNLIGDEDGTTEIATSLNSTALIVSKGSIRPTKILNIFFRNAYGLNKTCDGVQISAIVDMENCWVKSFGGNGITVSADVGKLKTNASFSKFSNLLISENSGHGIYFQGGDANQCSVIHCDARDNKGIGFYDHSFLGNQFFGCMAHYNGAKVLPNYSADDPNNRATFIGCYSEQGSAPEILAGCATWHGGLAANGFELRSWAKVFTKEPSALPTRKVLS